MFCTNCGKQMPDGSAFCTSCGNKMAVVPVQEATTSVVENVTNEEVVEVAVQDLPEETKVEAVMDQPSENEVDEAPAAVVELPATEISQPDINPVAPQATSAPVITPVIPQTSATASTPANPKKSNSSPIIIVIGLVAVIALLFLIFGKGTGYKDYKDLVNDYYSAVYKEDFNALVKLYDKDAQKDMKEDKDEIKDAIEDAKDLFDDTYDKGWQKKVKAGKSTRVEKDDDVTYYTVPVDIGKRKDAVGIKKIKDKYYIDEDRDHIAD